MALTTWQPAEGHAARCGCDHACPVHGCHIVIRQAVDAMRTLRWWALELVTPAPDERGS